LFDDWSTAHVTIADALSHRSGLPRHDNAWALGNSTVGEVVRKMRYLPLTAPIRTEFQYCNLMFVTMAHLLETATGQYLGDFLRERIWEPLGMKETFMSVSEAQAAGVPLSRGYEVNRTGGYEDRGYDICPQARGAGNVVSSAADYAKWVRAMIDRAPPISETSHAALVRAHSIAVPDIEPPESAPVTYGLGWFIHSYRGEVLIEHTGSQPGFGTGVFYLPDREFGIVLFTNNMVGGGAAISVLAYHLIDEFLGTPTEERFDWVSFGDTQVPNMTVTPDQLRDLYPSVPDPPLSPPADASAYTGVYVHPAYPTLIITADCPPSAFLPPFPHKEAPSETVKICVDSLLSYKEKPVEFMHVSGDFWVFGEESWGQPFISRAEFRLGPNGRVQQLGVEWEPAMTAKGEKIWYERDIGYGV
jgi:CubicO group peptidase (beta-lactamase class C family)